MSLLAELRTEIPVLRRLIRGMPVVYLDNAATTLTPELVIEAINSYYRTVSSNIHRGQNQLSDEATGHVDSVRALLAAHLGVRTRNIVFTSGTTSGINLVAASLPAASNRTVLTTDAHYSAQLPWRRRGAVDWVDCDDDGPIPADFTRALEREPDVVVLTACSNVTGHTVDLAELSRLARGAGAVTVVDAAQLVPHTRPVLTDDVDAFAFSAHKMLGPTGIGVLCLSDRLIDILQEPGFLGGGTVHSGSLTDYRLHPAPQRFEAGTLDIAGIYGLGAAVSYLNALGPEVLEARVREICSLLNEEIDQRPHVDVIGGTRGPDHTSIASLLIDGVTDSAAFAREMSDSHGVMVRAGYFCAQPFFAHRGLGPALRISPYIYNTDDEIRFAFQAMDKVRGRTA